MFTLRLRVEGAGSAWRPSGAIGEGIGFETGSRLNTGLGLDIGLGLDFSVALDIGSGLGAGRCTFCAASRRLRSLMAA